MSPNDPARRGFLRALAALPLVGGGVTLLGHPTAAAEPITPDLLDAYDEWLDIERSYLKWERFGPDGFGRADLVEHVAVYQSRLTGEVFDVRPCNRMSGHGYGRNGDSPAARAAVILAAAGCGWRSDRDPGGRR